jgi:hypothetical protein
LSSYNDYTGRPPLQVSPHVSSVRHEKYGAGGTALFEARSHLDLTVGSAFARPVPATAHLWRASHDFAAFFNMIYEVSLTASLAHTATGAGTNRYRHRPSGPMPVGARCRCSMRVRLCGYRTIESTPGTTPSKDAHRGTRRGSHDPRPR